MERRNDPTKKRSEHRVVSEGDDALFLSLLLSERAEQEIQKENVTDAVYCMRECASLCITFRCMDPDSLSFSKETALKSHTLTLQEAIPVVGLDPTQSRSHTWMLFVEVAVTVTVTNTFRKRKFAAEDVIWRRICIIMCKAG